MLYIMQVWWVECSFGEGPNPNTPDLDPQKHGVHRGNILYWILALQNKVDMFVYFYQLIYTVY